MAFLFENLQVYRKAVDFADQIMAATRTFPRGYYFLVDQLGRAAVSISTNIAEGNWRFAKADRGNFFVIARGSARGWVPLPEISLVRGLIDVCRGSSLRAMLAEAARMLSGLIGGLERRSA